MLLFVLYLFLFLILGQIDGKPSGLAVFPEADLYSCQGKQFQVSMGVSLMWYFSSKMCMFCSHLGNAASIHFLTSVLVKQGQHHSPHTNPCLPFGSNPVPRRTKITMKATVSFQHTIGWMIDQNQHWQCIPKQLTIRQQRKVGLVYTIKDNSSNIRKLPLIWFLLLFSFGLNQCKGINPIDQFGQILITKKDFIFPPKLNT